MGRPWLRIALIVSVVLNVFLVGAALGVLALGAQLARSNPPPGPGIRGGQLWRASQTLPPATARAFRQQVRAQSQATRPLAQAARQLRRQAWLTGANDTFDANATKAALAQARTADMAMRERLEGILVDIAGALPADQRRSVFRAMAEPGAAPRSGRFGPRQDGPPEGGPLGPRPPPPDAQGEGPPP